MIRLISTAIAHPNKAIVIYWGNSDDRLNLPSRTSLSMTLQGVDRPLDYTVTMQTSGAIVADKVIIDGKEDTGQIYSEIARHVGAMRDITGFREKLVISTRATFPVGSGLAGSAAAASALAEAFAAITGGEINRKTISMMARRGSGSAARSVFGGFVRLDKGERGQSFATQLVDENHWDLRDVIAVVDAGPKKVKSSDGMRLSARTCPAEIYTGFVGAAEASVLEVQDAIESRDVRALGEIYEFDNALFREVCVNTEPPLDYWTKATAEVFNAVTALRSEGMAVFAGTDAGPNVHVICEPTDTGKLIEELRKIEGVRDIIHARPGGPSQRSDAHLA